MIHIYHIVIIVINVLLASESTKKTSHSQLGDTQRLRHASLCLQEVGTFGASPDLGATAVLSQFV